MLRLTAPTLEPIALDDFARASSELPKQAKQAKRLVEENAKHLEVFFDVPRACVAFHHGPRSESGAA
jgi:hypothetical protein